MDYKIIIDTKYPIAFDSNDHLFPLGTRNDNYSKEAFIIDIEQSFKTNRPLHFMDLGCAGGRLVRDVLQRGHIAVGLEGSDFNARTHRAEWPELYLKNIFTCDISREYSVLIQDENEKKLFSCDVISAWEVVEHIPTDRLTVFFENIRKHLKIGGHFYAGICQADSVVSGIVFHNSVFPKEHWKTAILNNLYGLTLHEYPYPLQNAVHYDPNSSFYIMLERTA
jgi:SAM-dependent methyltransferase